MDVRVKRAYDDPADDDGYRVLIDRLWPRGVARERARLDEWARELAPSTELRRWFGHDPDRFSEFRVRYTSELESQRPKLDEYGQELFAILRTVERDAPDADLAVGQVAVFVGRNYILSIRKHAKKGFADVRTRTEREPDLLRHGSGYVLYALMDSVVDRYFPILDSLEEELERLEESIFRMTPSRASIRSRWWRRD